MSKFNYFRSDHVRSIIHIHLRNSLFIVRMKKPQYQLQHKSKMLNNKKSKMGGKKNHVQYAYPNGGGFLPPQMMQQPPMPFQQQPMPFPPQMMQQQPMPFSHQKKSKKNGPPPNPFAFMSPDQRMSLLRPHNISFTFNEMLQHVPPQPPQYPVPQQQMMPQYPVPQQQMNYPGFNQQGMNEGGPQVFYPGFMQQRQKSNKRRH